MKIFNTDVNIGVSIPYRNSDFMDRIMKSGIADCGDSGDVYAYDNLIDIAKSKMSDEEFNNFLEECGIGADRFKNW